MRIGDGEGMQFVSVADKNGKKLSQQPWHNPVNMLNTIELSALNGSVAGYMNSISIKPLKRKEASHLKDSSGSRNSCRKDLGQAERTRDKSLDKLGGRNPLSAMEGGWILF